MNLNEKIALLKLYYEPYASCLNFIEKNYINNNISENEFAQWYEPMVVNFLFVLYENDIRLNISKILYNFDRDFVLLLSNSKLYSKLIVISKTDYILSTIEQEYHYTFSEIIEEIIKAKIIEDDHGAK